MVPEAWNRVPHLTPEHLVAAVFEAPVELLAETVAGRSGGIRFIDATHDQAARFLCPLCHAQRGDGCPTAALVDGWRWRCDACGALRTRALLERLVVEDPVLLLRLGELLRRRELDEADDGPDPAA